MAPRPDRFDYLMALGLSIITVLSRLPYRARMLYNWDAVQFALALNEYDVVKHQPHPPGYILYVALGRLVHGLTGDAAGAYVLLAVALRQSLLLLLFPLGLGATLAGGRRLRTVVLGLGILSAAVLAWFLPMIWLTGGLARYLEASRQLADTVVKPTSILGGPLDVTLRMSRYLLESVLVALGPLAAAALLLPWYVRRYGWGAREWFL